MKIPFFVINLDSSRERWEKLSARAALLGIEVHRVIGIDGSSVDRRVWTDVDPIAFAKQHGRTILPGEYGCYQSHLKALELAFECGSPYAVIIEDDVRPDEQTIARVDAIIDSVPNFDIIKLINHRATFFLPKIRTSHCDEIGQVLHGPQGSAAAYLVTRSGARKLHHALRTMKLPWDVALERYWSTGVKFYTCKKNILTLDAKRGKSTVSPDGYRASTLPLLKRVPTALFRAVDLWHRAISGIRHD